MGQQQTQTPTHRLHLNEFRLDGVDPINAQCSIAPRFLESREDNQAPAPNALSATSICLNNDADDLASILGQPEPIEVVEPKPSETDKGLEDVMTSPQSTQILTTSPPDRGRRPSEEIIQRTKSRIPSAPIDLPTTLIEYWFTHVCSMWSAYDSETNPNRQLALSTCFTSEPVFYAMQSMSAACLVDSLPHLKPVLASTSGNALAAINRNLEIYYDLSAPLNNTLPKDLLLAIFAMATSLCWADTKQLGEPLVLGARTILMRHQDSDHGLGREDLKNLSHFHHALKYVEMLLNFVSSESAYFELETMRDKHRQKLCRLVKWNNPPDEFKVEAEAVTSTCGPEADSTLDDSLLHPWTGVSQKVQERFGLSLALCRDHHMRRKANAQSASALCESLCDIEVARELVKDLIHSGFSRDYDIADGTSSTFETGDLSTPLTHLMDTAEAYRLAALLQLYLTFEDLEVRLDDPVKDSERSATNATGNLTRHQALVTLTLLLVDVLQRIPADSGTRCIQPVLYVSAATGLRFDTPVTADFDFTPLTQCTIEVSRARRFIMDRLQTLLRSLPPRPISVALNLVKAIWKDYDYGENGYSGRHWMDVMMETGLQTLFG